jgi:hypothetical protein
MLLDLNRCYGARHSNLSHRRVGFGGADQFVFGNMDKLADTGRGQTSS